MKHYVYYEADGEIREIGARLTNATEMFIEVDYEMVRPFFELTEHVELWYVTRVKRELKKRPPQRHIWQQRHLLPFRPPNYGAGLLATYENGVFHFELSGEFAQEAIRNFWLIAGLRGDPHHIIAAIEIDYLKLFNEPIDIAVNIAEDFWLYSVIPIFPNMMLWKK